MVNRAVLLAALLFVGGCVDLGVAKEPVTSATQSQAVNEATSRGRLLARPRAVTSNGLAGTFEIGTGGRPALLLVPATYDPKTPAPLAVMLHGAGGNARSGLELIRHQAEQDGIVVLAPQSRDSTWDVIVDRFGPDVAAIDAALEHVFASYAVDRQRLAIGGFSDGASYALTLGLANGDLFSHIVGFSPGFDAAPAEVGRPLIYVSHGIDDEVLPIDRCSRQIVPQLQRDGYVVTYHEFDGSHTVPVEIRAEAVAWLNGGDA